MENKTTHQCAYLRVSLDKSRWRRKRISRNTSWTSERNRRVCPWVASCAPAWRRFPGNKPRGEADRYWSVRTHGQTWEAVGKRISILKEFWPDVWLGHILLWLAEPSSLPRFRVFPLHGLFTVRLVSFRGKKWIKCWKRTSKSWH